MYISFNLQFYASHLRAVFSFLVSFLHCRPHLQPIFQAICAKSNKEPCCDWVGPEGAGHFVKMVHNGIEYGDMQLICEAYSILRQALGISCDEISQVCLGGCVR